VTRDYSRACVTGSVVCLRHDDFICAYMQENGIISTQGRMNQEALRHMTTLGTPIWTSLPHLYQIKSQLIAAEHLS